jgi:hypothetical protein
VLCANATLPIKLSTGTPETASSMPNTEKSRTTERLAIVSVGEPRGMRLRCLRLGVMSCSRLMSCVVTLLATRTSIYRRAGRWSPGIIKQLQIMQQGRGDGASGAPLITLLDSVLVHECIEHQRNTHVAIITFMTERVPGFHPCTLCRPGRPPKQNASGDSNFTQPTSTPTLINYVPSKKAFPWSQILPLLGPGLST